MLRLIGVFLLQLVLAFVPAVSSAAEPVQCTPTRPDMLGPFFKPDAPVRTVIGSGYVLSGKVLTSQGCRPIPNVRIEIWQTGTDGSYDDAHRATLFSDESGSYSLETDMPLPYFGRPPHIHVKVSEPGFKTLITQHYPVPGASKGDFDLILVPEN